MFSSVGVGDLVLITTKCDNNAILTAVRLVISLLCIIVFTIQHFSRFLFCRIQMVSSIVYQCIYNFLTSDVLVLTFVYRKHQLLTLILLEIPFETNLQLNSGPRRKHPGTFVNCKQQFDVCTLCVCGHHICFVNRFRVTQQENFRKFVN